VRPDTCYATAGDISIAYQTLGGGDRDLVLVFPFVTHLDLIWDSPKLSSFVERLTSLGRVILFDKRGMGLSDPVNEPPTLEERMDDLRAVMDDCGSDRATLFGMSEGGPMSILFAATYPQRTERLVMFGSMARALADDDYPWGPSREAVQEANEELIAPLWGQGATIDIFAPSIAHLPAAREAQARTERQAASPKRIEQLFQMFLDFDVRDVLGVLDVPTLVMHRTDDRAVNVRAGRWLAGQIEGARFVELPGPDHFPWIGDTDAVIAEVEEMLTGERSRPVPDRVLATVLFTDVVRSTQTAAELGDRRWREVLEEHQRIVRRELDRFRGCEVKTTGDGFLATFDGPARAVRAAEAVIATVAPLGLQVRAGVHTGEVEEMGSDVGGIAVHIASRVCDLADPGRVLATRTVRDLVAGSGLVFEARGMHALKGVPEDWELYAVTPG